MTYFKSYADQNGLRKFIRFGTKVLSLHPLGKKSFEEGAGESHDGKWEIVYTDATDPSPAKTVRAVFDKVIVSTGHHWKPLVPKFSGLDDFKGEVLHSHYYREAHPYKEKRCLVIGIGNSAVDLAVEMSFHAKQVHLASRRSAWVVPRYATTGAPADQVLSRAFYWLPLFLRNLIYRIAVWILWGNISRFGLFPAHQPFSAHSTVNGELFSRIGTGTLKLQKNVKRFLPGPGIEGGKGRVEFEDGTQADVDVVVLCTGYEVGYPFLDARTITGLDPGSNRVSMYKFVWPLKHKNIAFIGLVQPYGSIMPIAEIQNRWVARVFSGKVKSLPSIEVMEADVEKVRKEMAERYLASQRHTIQVDAGPYMDSIGAEIGCTPNLWAYFVTDPLLWFKLVFGSWNPHQYRLQGPDAWKGARNEIFAVNGGYDYRKWKGFS